MQETIKKPPGIIAIISEILSQNLNTLLSEPVRVKVENLSFDVFQSEADKIKAGRFMYVYTESDRAVMNLLLPEAAQKIFFSKFPDFKGKGKDDAALTELLNRISGNLPYLCAVKEKGAQSNVFTLQKAYTIDLKDQLLWDASECNVYRCSVFGVVFYLSLNIELQKAIELFLKTDPGYNKALKTMISSEKVLKDGLTAVNNSDIIVNVKNPLEFIIGSCFLPREAYIGKKDTSVVFKEIIAAPKPASYINDGMIWYRFWIESAGVEYSIFYSVDVKGQQKKYFQFFKQLFTEMVKHTSVFLRGQLGFERAGGKIVSPPPAEDLEDVIILNANISWEGNRVVTGIFIPRRLFSGYLSAFLAPWEVEVLKKNKFSALLFILSINSTIFGKNIETFYRQTGLGRADGKIPPIGVSKILAILDTSHASRLVQNYFLSSGGSLLEFQSLFLYQYNTSIDEGAKVGRDALFNKEEYKKFIPKALHADWDLCSTTSATYEELLALNEKALRGIYTAIQDDKLLMPYKVSYVLYNEFQKPLDARFKAEISRLIEEDPWPALIDIIPKKSGQQVISATPNSKLGMALVPGRPEVRELAHFMSKTKRQELEEEVRINTKKYDKGSLPAEKVFKAMEELLEILDKLANPDDEMV
ncbi:MAG: hypothetical protein JEZ04_18140 [Spirochaetales bacterium]|nr:hypothetical protein [Spirochaetales bacterium]